MKIALVSDHPGAPSAAGTQAYPPHPAARVFPLANALAGLGQQVTVYTREDPAPRANAPVLSPGVAIEPVPAGPPDPRPSGMPLPHIAAFAGELAARWRRDPPDVIHAHYWTSGLAALAGARDLGLPVVATFGELGGGGAGGGPTASAAARVRLEAAIGRSARAVLAGSAEERAALGRRGVPEASVTIVPPGVDLTRFRAAGPAAERSRRRLLLVSPPDDQPGMAVALRALAEVPDAELVIVGGPPDPELSRLARTLHVHERVTGRGAVSEAAMPTLMRSADVLVHLTPSPLFATVPVEAMACGTPVVAAHDAASGGAIIDGNTGFLVPPGEAGELARRVRQLLARPMLRDGYAIAAASRVRSRYGWERIAQETLAAYEVLGAPQPQPDLEAAA